MWRQILSLTILCFVSARLYAQSSDELDMILRLTGYDSPEQLDEYELERLWSYVEKPLRINAVSAATLHSSGMFSSYQSVSLIDYRTRHGDILSLGELSLVDGFSRDFVNRICPFITLAGGEAIEAGKSVKRISSDLAVRGGVKISDGTSAGQYSFRYGCEVEERLSFGFSMARTSSVNLELPDIFTGYLSWTPERIPLKIVVGDFNARFGQGLALWNGFSMNGLSKVSSFHKSATGISPSSSFTGSSAVTGFASEYMVSRFRISSLVMIPGIKTGDFTSFLPAVNIGWYGRNMSMSLTHYSRFDTTPFHIPDMKTSVDIALCIRGTDIFSELAFDWVNIVPAMLGGVSFPLKELFRMALHLRIYPSSFNPALSAAPRSGGKCSNEYGASFCCDFSSDSGQYMGTLSLDAACFPVVKGDDGYRAQLKILSDWELNFQSGFKVKLRASERIRTWGRNFRTDVRLDTEWKPGKFILSSRVNVVRCVGTGLLAYIEGGYKTENISVYLKQGYYNVSEWDDRIYSYERDAPGSFNVPAFYGQGLWTSLVMSWKFARWGKAYLRTAIKPGNAELKLQCVFSF